MPPLFLIMKKLVLILFSIVLVLLSKPVDASTPLGVTWLEPIIPFTLTIYDATNDSIWQPHINNAISVWSQSTVLDLQVVKDTGKCQKHPNAITICNEMISVANPEYGHSEIHTGNGQTKGYISYAIVYLNSYYDNQFSFDETFGLHYFQAVACHELGHTIGLGESYYPENSCMVPGQLLTYPDQSDYDLLESMYKR